MDHSSPSSTSLRRFKTDVVAKLAALVIFGVMLGFVSDAALASDFPINVKISRGRVVSSPPGLDCTGSAAGPMTTCPTAFVAGDPANVTLTFIPFEHVHVKASFDDLNRGIGLGYQESVTLPLLGGIRAQINGWEFPKVQATTSGSGSGRIVSSPAGIDCSTGGGAGCTAWFNWAPYEPDLIVTFTAISTGGVFAGWSGNCANGTPGISGGNPTIQKFVLQASTCDARFDVAP